MEEPVQFEHRPFRADHAVALLSRPYPQAKVQAADLGLFALMTFRLAEPLALSDLADPADLCYVRIARGELRIGSLTRHADLLSSAVAGEHFAILRDAGRAIASREVRCSETIGGMLCQADPAEDMAAVFAAVRASMVIRGRDGTRTVSARDFHRGPYETVVQPGELLTEIRIPIRPCGSAYEKVSRRAGDCPVTGAAAVVWLDGDTVTAAGLALTPGGAQNRGPVATEEFLAGARATPASFDRAGEFAAGHCECSADLRYPARDPQCMAGHLASRALGRALLRARGQDAPLAGFR
jgi:carbon-monoxide dehydrogenase medium subunit